jgi:cold shock CspA family protein
MSTSVLSGCVKWFNSKHKYGFITISTEGEFKNVDIFVHQSNIITKEPCYRFLVVGENVKFELKTTDDEKHPNQAVNVKDVNDAPLKCEVPRDNNPRVFNSRGGGSSRGGGGGGGGGGGYIRGGSFSGEGNGGFRGGNGGSRGGGSFTRGSNYNGSNSQDNTNTEGGFRSGVRVATKLPNPSAKVTESKKTNSTM